MEEEGELLGIVEIGCVPAGQLDQFVEMLGPVIAAMGCA